MKKIDLGQMIGILANIGVIAGIIFLAIEVNQNRASLDEANTINAINSRSIGVERASAWRLLIGGSHDAARIYAAGAAGEELTPIDSLRFEMLCRDILWAQATSFERNAAIGNKQAAQAAIDGVRAQILENPGFRTCWEEVKGMISAYELESFVSSVDAE